MNVMQETIVPLFYKLGWTVVIVTVASIALKMFFYWLKRPRRKSNHVGNRRRHHSAVREGDAPACPYCGGRMVLRTRKSDGAKFYGCASYPSCRGIVNR